MIHGWSRVRRLVGCALAPLVLATCALSVEAAEPTRTASKSRSKASVNAVRKTRASARSVVRRRSSLASRRARELKAAQEPQFKLDESGDMVPDVRAAAAIVYNPETGQTLYSENAEGLRSMASITKVMTAAVFLEDNPDLDREVVVQRADVRAASTTHIRAGYRLQVRDLLNLLLIASDNAAARALARVSSFGPKGFIDRMNTKALELGLTSTSYADPAGLLAANVSSALDLAKLITHVSADERIASIMQKPTYSFRVGKRTVEVRSTNQLVRAGDVDVQAGKTGFTRSAGYCLATLLKLPQGSPVAVVVLGARSSASRFWDTRHLANWLSAKMDIPGFTPSALPISSLPQ
ncbi:MAG: D-alanyl-D-alanine carboxypeptidase family protein [Vicinamibacterales bacterium]